MFRTKLRLILALAVAGFILSACTPQQIYRPNIKVCVSAEPKQKCRENALQVYRDPAQPDAAYTLGFIEFDDQGQLWARKQMHAVIDELHKHPLDKDMIVVVFVHGWKHSAAPEDSNIGSFRGVLKRVSEIEARFSRTFNKARRRVFGIYLGWRGGSITVPGIEELTFWERKETAQKVGHGGVTEVLMRLELIKKMRNSRIAEGGENRTRLVVVGHSFGGALVFSAISQILEGRFVETSGRADVVADARSFGDLVVLINPAFEAARYSTLSDMANERRTYFPSQRPLLVVLTSEADEATGTAFAIGRSLSTIFESERVVTRENAVNRQDVGIDQRQSNITAVGHFAPYRTHYLRAVEIQPHRMKPTLDEEMDMLKNVGNGWKADKPGNVIKFQGSVLERTSNSVGRNPYLMVQVDKALIPNHNDIYDPRIMTFLRQLIFLSVQ